MPLVDWLLLGIFIVAGVLYGGLLYVARGWVVPSLLVWLGVTPFLLVMVGILPV